MKPTVLFVMGLSILAAGCNKKAVGTNAPNIPPPVVVPPDAPPAAKPKPATTGGGTTQPAKQAAQPPAAAPKKLTPQQREELNTLLARLGDAFFDYNQATIRVDATKALTDDVTVIRNILSDYPSEKLLIEGHADERGSSEYNLALAERRSKAAQDFLSTRGIPQNQLRVLSYGEERPVCKDQTEACFQQNRRIHITVAP